MCITISVLLHPDLWVIGSTRDLIFTSTGTNVGMGADWRSPIMLASLSRMLSAVVSPDSSYCLLLCFGSRESGHAEFFFFAWL